MTNTFNTGRHYSEDGQVIHWKVIGERLCPITEFMDTVVWFEDVTRNIGGEMVLPMDNPRDRDILSAYDANAYHDVKDADKAQDFHAWAREAHAA